jgi:transposase
MHRLDTDSEDHCSIRHREAELFDCKRSIILYDLTNTHFEGLCANNPKARHGKNKQKRNDCRQVAVGMAFDERGYSYLINITRDRRLKYAAQFAQDGFEPLPGRTPEMRVEVCRIPDPEDAQSSLILCRSAQRCAKETAMLSKAETRFLTDVEALRKLIAAGKLKKPDLIQRRIGRLQKKHPRAARFYTLHHSAAQGFTAQRDDEKHSQASEVLGNDILRTDHTLDAAQTWSLYMTLLQAEEGFCALKSTLGIRPNDHQLEGRVDGHIFISALAYHLLT